MLLEQVFSEVYNEFINGNYTVANPKNRDQTKRGTSPKMNPEQALQHTVNYILWEWSNDRSDNKFKKLVKVVCLPPTDYDLSKVTFKELLEVICPELIKTTDILNTKLCQ